MSEWFLFNWCKTHLLSYCIKTNACDASRPKKKSRSFVIWYVLYNYFSKDSGLPWTLYPLSWIGHSIEINFKCSALLEIWYYFTSYHNNIYTLFDGFIAYSTCRYFASCVVFFRALQGRGKIRAMSKMSARIIC